MSNPSNFVSFADYLGLNDEAGQAMLDKTLATAAPKGGLDEIQRLEQAHQNSAGDSKDGGVFARTGEAVRTGLASYGDFMKGMMDPASRQALLEKTYGKGGASWFDSALTGAAGGAQLGAANEQFKTFKSGVEADSQRADDRRGYWQQNDKQFQEGQARDTAARQKAYTRDQKMKADRTAQEENRKLSAYNKSKGLTGWDAPNNGVKMPWEAPWDNSPAAQKSRRDQQMQAMNEDLKSNTSQNFNVDTTGAGVWSGVDYTKR